MKRLAYALATLSVALIISRAPAAEYVQNGTFEGGFVASGLSGPLDLVADNVPNQWTRLETFSGGIAETASIQPANLNGPSAPGQWSTRFSRIVPENHSGDWTALAQNLNIQAANFQSLTLSLDVMVSMHDLPAGGWVNPAFEWPAVVEISYTTTGGQNQVWRYGWYLDPPGDDAGSPLIDPGQGLIPVYKDQLVPLNAWVPNGFNLFNELPQVQTINQIVVGGSGWQYESYIDNVSLQGVQASVPDPVATLPLLVMGLVVLRGILSVRPGKCAASG